MIKDIKYNGYTAQPSDYECHDGELAASLNLISEESQIKPILAPIEELRIEGLLRFFHIHKTSAFTHYIYLRFNAEQYYNELWYYDGESKNKERILILTTLEVLSVNSIGNTLVMVANDTVYYCLWNGTKYTNLGRHLPEINLSFGLQGHPRLFSKSDSSKSTFTITFNEMKVSDMLGEFPDTQKNQITEQIMAKVNKFLAEQSVNKGRFALPFFVRYGLRLYDGSLVMHSAPILMSPCTTNNPIVYWTEAYSSDTNTGVKNAVCNMMLVACDLDYAYDNVTSDDIDQWGDIVKSVDIFISKPIYPYDQNGKIKSCKDSNDFDSVFVGRLLSNGQSGSIADDKVLSPVSGAELLDSYYNQWLYEQIYAMYFSANRKRPWSVFRLPEYSNEKNAEGIKSCNSFYLLHSIKLSDLSRERKVIPVKEDYLQSLVTREVMTDDYQTHDRIVPKYTFCYNSRINFANIKRQLFKGFQMSSMLSFCNTRMNFRINGTTIELSRPTINWSHLTDRYSIIVYIKENGEDKTVCCNGSYDKVLCNFLTDEGNSLNRGESWGCYFFYPNVNAYKMRIVPLGYNSGVQNGKCYDINLLPHDFLNGAYALLDYDLIRNSSENFYSSTENSTTFINSINKIYTSEVNNPFYFPLLGINTVGTGKILGICTAAKALSEGQFGQFPLYAFTDEGVWALEVSSTGSYSAKQPITRDVILNDTEPLQMDNAVLFATDRGIMLISGSQTQCITDVINSKEPFDVLQLPGMAKLHSMLGHNADTCLPTAPFLEFIAECGMLYDYVHQRVIVYNPHYTYAYVYSLKSKEWGMMYSTIEAGINSYPEALAVDHDGALLNFSAMEGEATKGLFVTRPIKLETPDVLKTMDTVIQRGHFQKGHVQSVLYGSRDLYNWHLVWSSKDHYLRGFRGTPYKYFRIALLCNLSPDESIFGASLQFTPRLTNQPR
nr:MAG TPA: hypothetical protein [Caudoviricetes sp.]